MNSYEKVLDFIQGGPEKRKKKIKLEIEYLQKKVAAYFNLSPSLLTEKKRPKELVAPRQIAMYLSKEITGHYFDQIGECFRRDPTTVIYAYYKIKNQMEHDLSMKETITQLSCEIQKGIKEVHSEELQHQNT